MEEKTMGLLRGFATYWMARRFPKLATAGLAYSMYRRYRNRHY